MTPRVSFIVASLEARRTENPRYHSNKSTSVADLLFSIKENVTLSHETVLVVNDHQNEELVELATRRDLVTKSCVNSTNVGVARAWNMGAMMAEGANLCWVNDDVVIGEGAIERLCEVLESSDSIGEVGPQGALRVRSGPLRGLPERRVGLAAVEEADEISGFLFVIKSPVFHEVGGFDINYTPAFYEEIDISFAIRKLGYRCLVVPGLRITHGKHGVSGGRTTITYFDRTVESDQLTNTNHLYFVRKWLDSNSGQLRKTGVGSVGPIASSTKRSGEAGTLSDRFVLFVVANYHRFGRIPGLRLFKRAVRALLLRW